MSRCLHPFKILHPTLRKWKDEQISQGKVIDKAKMDAFCRLHHIESSLEVPCGKCLYCYQHKQEQWRVRLQQEVKDSFSCFFCTLTYAPEFEPKDGVKKSDFQKFMKRFRYNMAIPLRFFAVSEYGPQGTHRPHYHFALFFKSYVDKEEVYLQLQNSWHSIVHVENLTDGRISYLSTYCIKFFNEAPSGRNTNFMLCSTRPFIGSGYLTREMCDNMRQKLQPYISVNGFKKPLPRIYKTKVFDDEQLILIRKNQEVYNQRYQRDLMADFASPSAFYEAAREQARRDYKRAWQRFKESKKL